MDGERLTIRCFCSRRPILAVCGRSTVTRKPFVHIKSWRQNRIYTEVVVTEGTAQIRCRECHRWHRVVIKHIEVEATQAKLPEGISV